MKKIHRIFLLIMTAVILITCASCNGEQSVADDTSDPHSSVIVTESPNVSTPVSGGVLRLASLSFDSLNPLTTDSEDIKQYMALVYSDFVSLDHSGKAVPEIAESWESNDDLSVWTFKIRNGVSWHNGGILTANDVVSTINFINTKGGIYADNIKYIKSVEATDPMTVTVICTTPCGVLPDMMSFPILKSDSINTAGTMPVGSGMYSFNYIKSSQNKIYLDRFKDYYGDKPYIDAVEIVTYATETEKYRAESDFSVVYDGIVKSESIKENVMRRTCSGNLFTFMYFNLNGNGNYAAVSDADVRKAVSAYINRGNIIDAAASGNATPAVLPIRKGHYLFTGDGASEYPDIAAGDELMKAAGYSKNESGFWTKDGVILDIVCVAPEDDMEFILAAKRLKKDLEEVGISVTVNLCNTDEYAFAVKNGAYSVIMTQISLSDYADIESVFKTGAKLNLNSYGNTDLDTLLDSVLKTKDVESLREQYGDITNILKDALPVCGLYIKAQTVVISDNLHGVTENGLYAWDVFANVDKWYIE